MDPRFLRLDLKTSFRAIADLILPRVCIVCDRVLLPCEEHLCTVCRADLPLTHFELLPRNPIADAFNALVEDSRYCYATSLI